MADSVKAVLEVLGNEKKKEGLSIERKEFFWDQFFKYITSAILALTVLNVSVEFLRGGGVSCFPPSDNIAISEDDLEGRMIYEFATGQTSYINNYCSRSVPKTEYFPIYILIHGLLLIVPHYVWNAVHIGDFNSFFSIAEKLDRLRDSSTGEYDTKNFDRVTKLELEYSGTRIYSLYILKLVLQLCIAVGSVCFSAAFFPDHEFSFVFYCPEAPNSMTCQDDSANNITCSKEVANEIIEGWPLNITVPCVYTSLRILNLVRYADFILLAIAVLLVLFGLSCLNADTHIFPSPLSWPRYRCFAQLKSTSKVPWLFTHYPKLHLKNLFSPCILNDLDFLLLMLFRADSSHGQVFKDIQINKDLKVFVGRDHQLLHLFINVQHDVNKGNLERMQRPKEKKVMDPQVQQIVDRAQVPSKKRHSMLQMDSDSASREDVLSEEEGTEKTVSDFHRLFLEPTSTDPEKSVFNYFKKFLGNLKYDEEMFSGMRDWIYYFARRFGPRRGRGPEERILRNKFAIDISFGSVGFARVLARPFVQVLSMDFHPFYRNLEEIANKKDFYTNHTTIRFPHDIFTQDTPKINEVSKLLSKSIKTKIDNVDFIVVGPLTEEHKIVVVNLLINLLFTIDCIGENAVLLAVRPLKVGSKKLTDRFYKYEPPQQLFRQKKIWVDDARKDRIHEVDDFTGLDVMLGQIPCVFEFVAYQYKLIPEVKVEETLSLSVSRTADKNKSSATSVAEIIESLPRPARQSIV